MRTTSASPGRRAGTRRPGVVRLVPVAVTTALVLAACSNGAATTSASAVTSKLGAVPIASAPASPIIPSADEHHPQLVAIGSAVAAHLPGGDAVVTALGPTEDLPSPAPAVPPTRVRGTITVRVAARSGIVSVRAADLSSRDDHGRVVALIPVGGSSAMASGRATASLTVRGVFHAGAAQITWRAHGHVVAVWDFNIELD